MTDHRPTDCRDRLRDEGKAYPRSGCGACRDGGLFGCPHEAKRPALSYPHVTDAEIVARECGINSVTLTRHIEGYIEPARSEGLAAPGLVPAQLLSDARQQLNEMKADRDRFAAMTAPPDLVEFLRVSGRQFEAYQAMAERALTAEAEAARLRHQKPVSMITYNTETGEQVYPTRLYEDTRTTKAEAECGYPGPCGWQGTRGAARDRQDHRTL